MHKNQLLRNMLRLTSYVSPAWVTVTVAEQLLPKSAMSPVSTTLFLAEVPILLHMAYLVLTVRFLIGIVFAVSATAKLRSPGAYRSFATWVRGLPGPFTRARVTPVMIALSEMAVVILVAIGPTAMAGLALAALILVVFVAGAALVIRRGTRTTCQCFGASRSPLGVRHVARDATLAAFAIVAITRVGSGDVRPAGIALSAGISFVVALIVFFLDDLVALFSEQVPLSRADDAWKADI